MTQYKDLLDTKKLGIRDAVLRMPLADRRALMQDMAGIYPPDQLQKTILPALQQLQSGITALYRPRVQQMDEKAVANVMETVTSSIAIALSAQKGTAKHQAIGELVAIHTAAVLLEEAPSILRTR
jgi:hypothetical protein